MSTVSPAELFARASELQQISEFDEALVVAQALLQNLNSAEADAASKIPAYKLLGEIYVGIGDVDVAHQSFMKVVELDPDDSLPEEKGGGPEHLLWLAQLSEEGGSDSVKWYSRGATVLRRQISQFDSNTSGPSDEVDLSRTEKCRELASALCSIAEVYMTDLSWESDAEQRCEACVTEATMVAPDSVEALQTLASVRISQLKYEQARTALSRSLELWKDLPPEDPTVPDFPVRISLSRLLMEAGMEDEALDVLERLVIEDDSSVEAWYLGGWCLHLLAEKQDGDSQDLGSRLQLQKASRDWLLTSLKLYMIQDYEDERLKGHAEELVHNLNAIVGPPNEDGEEDDEDDEEEEGQSGDEMEEDTEMNTG